MESGKDWKALGQAVINRRADLGYTQRELAARMNMSERILGAIEQAERGSYARSTVRALERGLLWEAGSVESLLAGGQPKELPIPSPAEGLAGMSDAELVAQISERITELARRLPARLPNAPTGMVGAAYDATAVEDENLETRRRTRSRFSHEA